MKRFKRASDIRVGIIGYGGAFNMAKAHWEQLKAEGAQLVAIADPAEDRRAQALADYPSVAVFATVEEMIHGSDVNFAVIITPHNTHAKLVVQCLRAGWHVVCEKPLAITTSECDLMLREAAKRDLLVTAYHNRHWDGTIREAVKRLVDEGAIGAIHRVEMRMGGYGKPGDWWRTSQSISGGILYDFGAHLLEYCFQVIRSDMVEVSGFARRGFWAPQTPWGEDTNEDEATAVIRFRNGTLATLRITNVDANPKPGIMEFTGESGAYVMHWDKYELIRQQGDKRVMETGKNPSSDWPAFYRNVVRHLVKGEALVITPEWSRRPIHVLDLAGRSAAQGRTLPVKYD